MWWHTSVISALGESEARESQGRGQPEPHSYLMSLRLAWATQGDPVILKKKRKLQYNCICSHPKAKISRNVIFNKCSYMKRISDSPTPPPETPPRRA
jgi:hypothetical protein